LSRWSYCKQHNVQLPDEYDRIYNDLEPFWGMNPVDLRRIQAELESERNSFTLAKAEDSGVALVAWALPEPGGDFALENHLAKAREIADMLKNVSQFIPPFRAVLSSHDNPYVAVSWELKTQLLHAAATQTCKYDHRGAFLGVLSDYSISLQISTLANPHLSSSLAGHLLVPRILFFATLLSISMSLLLLPLKRRSSTITRRRWIHATTHFSSTTTANSSVTALYHWIRL
jgi:hypothetical protein